MVDDDEESGGYAIGRRIYEKQEIDVRYSLISTNRIIILLKSIIIRFIIKIQFQADVKEGAMFKRDQKYDLKQAKDDFNLWDGVHGRDVLKHLEQFAKWEPGKKERERREKLALQALIEAEQERENGDGLGGTNLTSLC